MPSTIILEVIEGSLRGERFLFRGTARILVGRSRRCDVSLPDDPMHWDVSRTHCLIDVRPPHATIRDAGSRNGTYVNGRKIGQRAACLEPDACLGALSTPHRLRDGDRIQIGQTVFRVDLRPGVEGANDATMNLNADALPVGV